MEDVEAQHYLEVSVPSQKAESKSPRERLGVPQYD